MYGGVEAAPRPRGPVRLVSVLADLTAEFGWAPDAWRHLLVREFLAWHDEMHRRQAERSRLAAEHARRVELEAQRG